MVYEQVTGWIKQIIFILITNLQKSVHGCYACPSNGSGRRSLSLYDLDTIILQGLSKN